MLKAFCALLLYTGLGHFWGVLTQSCSESCLVWWIHASMDLLHANSCSYEHNSVLHFSPVFPITGTIPLIPLCQLPWLHLCITRGEFFAYLVQKSVDVSDILFLILLVVHPLMSFILSRLRVFCLTKPQQLSFQLVYNFSMFGVDISWHCKDFTSLRLSSLAASLLLSILHCQLLPDDWLCLSVNFVHAIELVFRNCLIFLWSPYSQILQSCLLHCSYQMTMGFQGTCDQSVYILIHYIS